VLSSQLHYKTLEFGENYDLEVVKELMVLVAFNLSTSLAKRDCLSVRISEELG